MNAVVTHVDPTRLGQVVLRGNPDVQAINMDEETVLLDLSTGTQIISGIYTILYDRLMSLPSEPSTILSPWSIN